MAAGDFTNVKAMLDAAEAKVTQIKADQEQDTKAEQEPTPEPELSVGAPDPTEASGFDDPLEPVPAPQTTEDFRLDRERRGAERKRAAEAALFQNVEGGWGDDHQRVPPARPLHGLAAALAATPAPAVGTITGARGTIASSLGQLVGSGIHAADSGRVEAHAVVLTVDRSVERLVVASEKAGARIAHVDEFRVLSQPAALAWLTQTATGAQSSAPLYVVVSPACGFSLDELGELARQAHAVVALIKEDDTDEPRWQCRQLEPVIAEAAVAVPPVAPAPEPIGPRATTVSEQELAAIVRQLVKRGCPEQVHTIDGHRLDVAYMGDDYGNVRKVELRGFVEHGGRLEELEVEGVSGLRSPISERQFSV